MSDKPTPGLPAHAAMQALYAMLEALPALQSFHITDRAARSALQPAMRLGPVASQPWSTSSSEGLRLTLELRLTSKTGSFTLLMEACDAIVERLQGVTAVIAGAHTVIQRVVSTRFDHEAKANLERADLKIELLLDLT